MISISDHEHHTRVTANTSNNYKSKIELNSNTTLDDQAKDKETKTPRKLNYSDVLKQKSNHSNEPTVISGTRVVYEEVSSSTVASSQLVACQDEIEPELEYDIKLDYMNDMNPDQKDFASVSSMSPAVHAAVAASMLSTNTNNFGVLNWRHVNKLDTLLRKDVQIHSSNRCNLPTINVRLKDFIRNLHRRLVDQRVKVRDVRINGGVASYVLARDDDYVFSDIDIIFSCDLLKLEPSANGTANANNETPINSELLFSNCCDVIKQCVFDSMLDYYPSTEKPTHQHLREAYVNKMAKIYQPVNQSTDQLSLAADSPFSFSESAQSLQSSSRWSLISLFNDHGQNIELKFVDKMKRQFQFSVDAFQIHLDSLLQYYDCKDSQTPQSQTASMDSYVNDDNESISSYCSSSASSSDSSASPYSSLSHHASQLSSPTSSAKMSENCFPTVIAESMYGDFDEAMFHLNEKLIATKSPEEIRGGGLLKYCNLIVRGYTPAYDMVQMRTIEKYMCSRFFIDFKDLVEQESQLNAYLNSHFYNEPHLCVSYLSKLYEVVNSSTVCLMGHERKLTLNLIETFAQRYNQYDQEQQFHESASQQLAECDIQSQQQQQGTFQQIIYVDDLNNDCENFSSEDCRSNSSSSSSCCSNLQGQNNETGSEFGVESVMENSNGDNSNQQRLAYNSNGQNYVRGSVNMGSNPQFFIQQQPQYGGFNHLNIANSASYQLNRASPTSQTNTHFLNAGNSIGNYVPTRAHSKSALKSHETSQVVISRKKSASSSFSGPSTKNMTNSFNYQHQFQSSGNFASHQFQTNQHKNKYPVMSSTSSSSSSTSPSPTPSVVYSYVGSLGMTPNVVNHSTTTLTQAKSSSASDLNFLSMSYSSSLSSSVASSMVSSPSPSPSPNFYITTSNNDEDESNDGSEDAAPALGDSENSNRTVNSTSNETLVLDSNEKKENDDDKTSNSSQNASSSDSVKASPTTPCNIFQCKIPSASSPYIEVYNYFCPPRVPFNATITPSASPSTPTVHYFKSIMNSGIQVFQHAPSMPTGMLAQQYNGSAVPVTFALPQAYNFVSSRPNHLAIPTSKSSACVNFAASQARPTELVN